MAVNFNQQQRRGGRFRSKTDAMNRRVHVWTCTHCGTQHKTSKPTDCQACGQHDFYFFPSQGEAARFAHLEMLQAAGHIKNLRVQVPYRIKVRDTLITTYFADFVYDEVIPGEPRSRQVIEDFKGSKDAVTDVFKLKKKLVEAVYQIEITIVTKP